MNWILVFFCIVFLSIGFSCSHDINENTEPINAEKTEIPLSKILKLAVKRKDFSLGLQENFIKDTAAIQIIQQYRVIDSRFDSITKLYEDFDLKRYDSLIWHPVMYAEEVNLDTDIEKELILIIGYKYSAPEIIFFDIVDQLYEMIGFEHIWLHNEYPEYEIMNISDFNPIIKTSQFYNRGSGAWLKVNHYYRMVNSKMQIVFRSPSSANMSLGFSGIYSRGRLLKDSFKTIGTERLTVSYEFNAKIDKRYVADTLKFEQVGVYENEIFSSTYEWDSLSNYFKTSGLDISKYLMNIENDTCMFQLISPKLMQMNTDVSRSYLDKYKNSDCKLY